MTGVITKILADIGPSVHIAPAGDFHIGPLVITNSILYGWICAALICFGMIWVARRVTVKPKGGVIQYVELAVEFMANVVRDAFEDPKIGERFVPFFVTLFVFILLNNWLGLLPLVGEGFYAGGHPLLRPFTGDLSGTLAMGVITMVLVYISSVIYSGGLLNYFRHFFVGNPLNPLFFFIGILEMLTDFTRVISLSLRLFLNITIGEIVIAVFAYLGHVIAPVTALPFTLLEILVGALQAYIFCILGVMYLAIAVNAAAEHREEDDQATESLTEHNVPETIGVTPGGSLSG
ncbi:MAG TPA: F0F1 ATP synthase subunit A [Candidatus Saccharimonadales bacterium]|nr:F0F1 ATP synthase subunit A [Candidatus Saccharimonadales bacterium]